MVLSNREYNRKTGLALVCPVTSKIKGYPFEVQLSGVKVNGAILSDQVKCLDWKARKAKFIEAADETILQDVLAKLAVILS